MTKLVLIVWRWCQAKERMSHFLLFHSPSTNFWLKKMFPLNTIVRSDYLTFERNLIWTADLDQPFQHPSLWGWDVRWYPVKIYFVSTPVCFFFVFMILQAVNGALSSVNKPFQQIKLESFCVGRRDLSMTRNLWRSKYQILSAITLTDWFSYFKRLQSTFYL